MNILTLFAGALGAWVINKIFNMSNVDVVIKNRGANNIMPVPKENFVSPTRFDLTFIVIKDDCYNLKFNFNGKYDKDFPDKSFLEENSEIKCNKIIYELTIVKIEFEDRLNNKYIKTILLYPIAFNEEKDVKIESNKFIQNNRKWKIIESFKNRINKNF